ncbi:hypothetical protein F5Y06DRAFT_295125 [Hypoxylon sp. FL0890]|nr:hypothetical protein F5Y06DRAFT_295125 [Hypoxylon sp. FL0890]
MPSSRQYWQELEAELQAIFGIIVVSLNNFGLIDIMTCGDMTIDKRYVMMAAESTAPPWNVDAQSPRSAAFIDDL